MTPVPGAKDDRSGVYLALSSTRTSEKVEDPASQDVVCVAKWIYVASRRLLEQTDYVHNPAFSRPV